jgi:N-acetylglucosaminyldiphosphoundecaprenol N-acetyl-beta-D-mannosaminyltransferase
MSDGTIKSRRSVRVLGAEVHPWTWPALQEAIVEAVAARRGSIIANHNLHSLYLYHHDADVRAFYGSADIIHIDGMSLVIFGKLLGLPLERAQRLTPLDWIRPLLAEAARRRWRVFYLGGKPGVAERAAVLFRGAFPALTLETAHGYFDARRASEENRAVLDAINRFGPDLLLVGMGMPRQEHWILEHRVDLAAGAIFNVGGLFDYIAGETATPPRWLGSVGLEWLFRLASDPTRLSKRYLVEPWFVLKLFLAELLRRRFSHAGH